MSFWRMTDRLHEFSQLCARQLNLVMVYIYGLVQNCSISITISNEDTAVLQMAIDMR